ncbi:5-hydroxytryptamine receptor 1D [Folsomia candida]|uniref:5-hydroxytryptamine receptor 1D n=1 Tax=Folsomia candida TaxID=158441 RepID=A0A226DN65_FOLCA|nr:5-hydroxytryptamine receptor 1D [Folsomia candida]
MSNLSVEARITLIVALTMVSFATVVTNGLVLLAWMFHKPVRKPQNIYLFSLAGTDLLIGILLTPTMVGELVTNTWPWDPMATGGVVIGASANTLPMHAMRHIIFLRRGIYFKWAMRHIRSPPLLSTFWMNDSTLLCTSSVFHLLAISIDRYYAVHDTVSYGKRRTFPFLLKRICLIWIISFWPIFPPMRDWEAIGDRSVQLGICVSNMSRELIVHCVIGCYLIPVILLTSSYVAIYRELQNRWKMQQCSRISEATTVGYDPPGTRSTSIIAGNKVQDAVPVLRRNRRAAKMLGIIIAAFSLSWLPFMVGYSITGFLPEGESPSSVILPFFAAIGYSNSFLNPCIYGYVNPDFRKAFHKIVCFWKR